MKRRAATPDLRASMGCFSTIILAVGFVLMMVTFIRWFEQTAEAVDNGWWNKVAVLLIMPFAVWFYPSRVSAGRALPAPLHEPVRGFGGLPRPPQEPDGQVTGAEVGAGVGESSPAGQTGEVAAVNVSSATDEPPPGTPPEFLSLPPVPPLRPRTTPDADKLAKLRQKMREQGMIPPADQD